ncbi:N-acetylmuramoyl-L-alanine amidase [Levilinea saccharolytica]|uniref:MurNAc-LAA domain-containing protein n=2 Tax=Levilinea saccharolytica TaxID=229921 RepID=A0A0N8GMN3_9CHLR|nr:N-acetylmuramoyl-L-alanine amidase [Levilinea saccharolytica]KPL75778.1 hypothetical protein ADN01_18355 [Levilinea saccharolytica]
MNNSIPSRPAPRPARTAPYSALNALQSVLTVGIIMATLLTMWTPSNLFSDQLLNEMLLAVQSGGFTPTPGAPLNTLTPSSRPRVGIVAGHWGYDSGAVCDDGLTELDVNLKIATYVRDYLIQAGYDVDLLKERDPLLVQYRAAALVSIHNDSCVYVNDEATGFKVAAAMYSAYPEKANRLETCLIQRYQALTNLKFHVNTITVDMTDYHMFNEIHTDTTAAIIETGFLNLDREILTQQPELVARGVANGIICYVNNETVDPLDVEETPAP